MPSFPLLGLQYRVQLNLLLIKWNLLIIKEVFQLSIFLKKVFSMNRQPCFLIFLFNSNRSNGCWWNFRKVFRIQNVKTTTVQIKITTERRKLYQQVIVSEYILLAVGKLAVKCTQVDFSSFILHFEMLPQHVQILKVLTIKFESFS